MKKTLFSFVLAMLLMSGVMAQSPKKTKSAKKATKSSHQMDHSKMKMNDNSGNMKGMDHGKMNGMDHSKMKKTN